MKEKKIYKLLINRAKHKIGTVVYRCEKYDFGLSEDDTRAFGVTHWSMTLDPTGDYPCFTVPLNKLEEIID